MIAVSVIIPTYKPDKYIWKCLNSLKNQTLNNEKFEVLIILNGEKEPYFKTIENYIKKNNLRNFKLIYTEKLGVSNARNIGLEVVKGEYCIGIDSDDYVEENYLEDMYNKAKKFDLDIVVANYYLENKNYKKEITDLEIKDSEIIDNKKYLDLFLKENFFGYIWNKLIKVDLYKKNLVKFQEKISLYEDVEVILKLIFFSEKIGKINHAYYHYIQRKNNCVNTPSLKKINDIKIVFDLLEVFFYEKKQEKISSELQKIKLKKLITHLWKVKEFSKEKIYKKIELEILDEIKKIKVNIDIFKSKKYLRENLYLYILNKLPYKSILKLLIKLDLILIKLKNKG